MKHITMLFQLLVLSAMAQIDSAYFPVTINMDAEITAKSLDPEFPTPFVFNTKAGESTILTLPVQEQTSQVKMVHKNKTESISLLPNGKGFLLLLPDEFVGGSVILYSLSGREIAKNRLLLNDQNFISANLSAGIYLLLVTSSHGEQLVKKVNSQGGDFQITTRYDSQQSIVSKVNTLRGTESITYELFIRPEDYRYRDTTVELSLFTGMNSARTYLLERVGVIGKKGVAKTTKTIGWDTLVQELNPYWHYSWGWELQPEEPDGVEFVPMIWGGSSKIDERIIYLNQLKEQGKLPFLLGFNEPDGVEQANMSVDEAIALWPKLESLGVPLGSPAVVNPLNEWLAEFIEKADQNGLRVDFITVHHYGGTNADGFMNKLAKVYELYQKPIWITEFAAADWSTPTLEENRFTPEDVLAYMQAILPKLEEADYIHRYAWFSFDQTSIQGWPSALYDSTGTLTMLGEFYSGFTGDLSR